MMSGDEGRVSNKARKNYPGEVSFGALSKEENEHSVAQVSRCTDTGTCAWTEDGTKPQLVGGLGEEVGGVSVLYVTVSVLVANPKHYFTLWPIQLYRIQYNTVQYQW